MTVYRSTEENNFQCTEYCEFKLLVSFDAITCIPSSNKGHPNKYSRNGSGQIVKFIAAARVILREDDKDPS